MVHFLMLQRMNFSTESRGNGSRLDALFMSKDVQAHSGQMTNFSVLAPELAFWSLLEPGVTNKQVSVGIVKQGHHSNFTTNSRTML